MTFKPYVRNSGDLEPSMWLLGSRWGYFVKQMCLTGTLLAYASTLNASGDVIIDPQTGATIVPPEGIVVTRGTGIPEWDFNPAPGVSGWPPRGRNNRYLCVLTLSTAAGYTASYLKDIVDDHMRGQGAIGPSSVVIAKSEKSFVMTSRWNITTGQDAGNTIFMYHAQTASAFAYMSCVTLGEEADKAKPLFRRIWDGLRLPN